ncbi:exodeoxyribonuclease VII small subunit [Candidatus Planktophila versatilis]|uniref:Exodeoxyribonuclease 7 small subunit n=1 Tax=Candidatus Planktophila versatilis TaxID=1884905 RepID=A0AAC9YWU9_9ACTN|nr:exodeoxyribonuclease VII small subunit [Candidatus Planktophila versatilis]ASY23236.1 exodeoxyribonuclease VII small subunit [Candidatus Planktophila versatilis]
MAAKDSQPSYEAARDELAEIVESLEDGSATLEESLKLWERGEELAKICQQWLDGAKKKLDAAKNSAKSEEQ